MFTGIVEELGEIKSIVKKSKSVRLTIAAHKVLEDVKLGDSIAVNGACLTVVEFANHWFTADAMPETVARTAMAELHTGDKVNLERALRIGDRLGGHIVSGHIDGIGEIRSKEKNDNAILVKIATDPELLRYIVEKGSVAIDGISLTVVNCGPDWFVVSLIPHTASLTTLGIKYCGQLVNLEVDIIGKYVEKMLAFKTSEPDKEKTGLTLDLLQQSGFV